MEMIDKFPIMLIDANFRRGDHAFNLAIIEPDIPTVNADIDNNITAALIGVGIHFPAAGLAGPLRFYVSAIQRQNVVDLFGFHAQGANDKGQLLLVDHHAAAFGAGLDMKFADDCRDQGNFADRAG